MRSYLLLVIPLLSIGTCTADEPTIRDALDSYLDQRFLPSGQAARATNELVRKLKAARLSVAEVEKLLRKGRARYPDPPKRDRTLKLHALKCDHVDYETSYFLLVPTSYRPEKSAPLLIVGHGGNSGMSRNYAKRASTSGIIPWIRIAEKEGIILAAPLTERGWGSVGNSVLISLLSQLQRDLHIDPNRIFVTGHSMGGHMTWRCGINMPDRWAAISPMSGGYDYVANEQVFNLVNVPGYATFGKREPYGINGFNRKIRTWMQKHEYDWKLIEKPGGHQIFADEIPKIVKFFQDRPRNLYRKTVYARFGRRVTFDRAEKNPRWPRPHVWKKNHPIPFGTSQWLRLPGLPEDTPQEKAIRKVRAQLAGDNRIEIVAENTSKVQLYLHPRMVNFQVPVEVIANGKRVLRKKVEPGLNTMLELVREFDDRGRIFYAMIEVSIPGSKKVPDPRGSR